MPSPAPVNGYCTLDELRGKLVLNWPTTDTTQDQTFCDIITGVSRAIDQRCNRYFYKSANDEDRYFTAVSPYRVFIGDLVSITALKTDDPSGPRTYGTTWAATDYDLWPFNGAALSEAEPYRWIERTPRGLYNFPARLSKGVKVTGKFGWTAVPSPVAKAALLWAERVVKRYSTPLGTQAMNALGGMSLKIPDADPDVLDLIDNYRTIGY